MKKISIVHIGTSEWFNYKQEIIFGLYHALRSVGHEVKISHNQLDANSINIIIGADWLVHDQNFDDIISSKIKYYIFEVEAFDGVTINGRDNFNLTNYIMLLQHAIGVITPYSYNINTIMQAKIIPSERLQYLRWGYFDELIDSNIVRSQSREIAGTFFGLLKGERLAKGRILQEQLGARVAFIGREHPHLYRAAVLANSDYAVSLAYGFNEKFVNPFRLYFLYANGIRVIADNITDEDGYLELATRVTFEQMSEALTSEPVDEKLLIEQARNNDLKRNIKSISI